MAAERTLERRFGPVTGACVVIANMIGVGVFTTTGYLLHDLGSPLVVLTGWLVGAVAALCGRASIWPRRRAACGPAPFGGPNAI